MWMFVAILSSLVVDSLSTLNLRPVSVYSLSPQWTIPMSYNRSSLYESLEMSGVGIIRKGPDFALDVEWEGFKRYDIAVSIDGERQHNACPNRMDAPVVKMNPLEVSHVILEGRSSQLHTGLGGAIRAYRRIPSETISSMFYFKGGMGSVPLIDAGAAVEWKRHGLYTRYYQARPYLRGDGKSFQDLYPYRELPEWGYRVLDMSLQGKTGKFRYGLFGRKFKDILFPYLMMDERSNVDVGGFLDYNGNHVYFTRIRHVMNNEFRRSRMLMENVGEVWSAGITGRVYEIFWRRWDITSTMQMMNMMPVQQSILPGLHTVHAAYARGFPWGDGWKINAKIGIQSSMVADTSRLALLENQYSDIRAQRWFVPWSIEMQRMGVVDWGVEAAMEPPEGEYLYMIFKRPMGQPSWYGNPTLAPALRITVRSEMPWKHYFRVRWFAHYVKHYVGLTFEDGMMPYYSYANIDALMLGYALRIQWKWVLITSTYTWAQNLTHRIPLAEVSPLKSTLQLISPPYYGMHSFVRCIYEAPQNRIDSMVGEVPTPGWWRVDAGVSYVRGPWHLSLKIANITNNVYYRHLSYLRNPFIVQRQVWDPGRTLTISLAYIPGH